MRAALWAHHRLLYNAFDYYAALFSEGEVASGEPEIYLVTFAAFMSLVETCRMAGKRTPHADFEVIFAIVDAPDRATKHLEKIANRGGGSQPLEVNRGGALSRQEWLQVVVRLAIYLHVTKGSVTDVSDAVGMLVTDQLRPLLPAFATQDSNDFRKRFCYSERVTAVLEAHAASLRHVFDVYAYTRRPTERRTALHGCPPDTAPHPLWQSTAA